MSCCRDKMLTMLLLLFLSTLCKATITITETGEHFASRPDHLVGTRFLEGVEYMARLQVFAYNLHLCPDPSYPHLNLTVQVPLDGLPVAILAKNGGCSVETKARLASFSVEPPGRLKYLIVYGDSHLETPMGLRPLDRDPEITVGILHVDEGSGRELLRTLADQSDTIKKAGGPRLLLDGRDANNHFARDVALWIGVAVMMMACLFSFALSVRAQRLGFRHEGVVIRREAPRRLTREQVDELLPEYNAGEENLVVHQLPSCVGCEEACSICLDEYEAGDKCRCLPCGHKFHSGCISKWLMERSSTCPLCKTDLLQDEDEDEDSEYIELREGGTQTGDDFLQLPLGSIFARMDRFFSSARSTGETWWRRRGQQGQLREQEVTMVEEGVSQQPLLEESESED